MINIQSIKFSFRNKFEKLLNDENRQSINSLFQQFCNMSPYDAKRILWEMSYNGLAPILDMGKELGIETEMEELDSKQLSTLRNELRYQYEKLHSNFMDVVVPDECQEAFKALEGRADIIVATTVYEHCQQHYIKCNAKRILSLLKSEEDRIYYGGIRSLGFYQEEANYLKPFHVQICNLFEAFCNHVRNAEDIFANKHLASLDKLIQEARRELAGSTQEEESEEETEFQHVQDDPKEETIQTSSEFRPLTSNEIRGHEDVFRLLEEINDLNVLVRIGQLGFDLNKVVAKKEEICKFLQADEAKIRISKTLEKANEAKKRAARAFAQSLQDLTEAAQALEEE